MSLKVEEWPIDRLVPYARNPRKNDAVVAKMVSAIREFGFRIPIVAKSDGSIVDGHLRYKAALEMGLQTVPVALADELTDTQVKAFRLLANRSANWAEWDDDLLKLELEELRAEDFPIEMIGFGPEEFDLGLEPEYAESGDADEVPEPLAKEASKAGDVWLCGDHRVMCGDSTDAETVALLMGGNKADMVFTDPPYGMGKEKDGVLNDNLNFDDLLEFNKKWIPLSFDAMKDVGSWYCWGIDEPLMDIYSNIIKPMVKNQQATFRNLITWDKGSGQGQMTEGCRMYPIADEKCLFVMCGVQGFNTNADNYFEGWEPVRQYLYNSRVAMGWDVPTMKRIVGHSDISRDHWTNKSQFSLIPEYAYKLLQEAAEKQRQEHGIKNDAFKREYDEIKREYYSTRAYFNNTHDNMNNVWHFDRTPEKERRQAGGHVTPKPIALCARAIKSSTREYDLVLDLFGGGGSTLIACEQNKRRCYTMEIAPAYCDVIVRRWQNFTGKQAVRESDGMLFDSLVEGR